MAKIKLGPIAAQASGSIGGTTFSRNRGGNYIRNRSIPTDPNTSAQQNVRAILGARSQEWASLTDAQRAAWENWAVQNLVTDVLGSQIQLSGHQAYVKLNSRLALTSSSLILVPPIVPAPPALLTIVQDGDIGAGDTDITFTATPLGAGLALWMRAAVVNSAGITYHANLDRFIGISAAAQASPYDNKTQIEAVFGSLIVDQTLHMSAAVFDTATGLLSPFLHDHVVITTT